MEGYKLKVKIGEHEFDAEGPIETVKAQFEAFKELIANVPAQKQPIIETVKATAPGGAGALALDKIMKNDGRVVSLTASSNTVADGVLLVLLGQRTYRANDSVTGGEIMDGLRQSGHTIGRVDYVLDKLSKEGTAITIGTGRARRYRLTNQGVTKAEETARELIARVP